MPSLARLISDSLMIKKRFKEFLSYFIGLRLSAGRTRYLKQIKELEAHEDDKLLI